MKKAFCILAIYGLLTLFPVTVEAAREERFALVIGNAAYPVGALRNPVNDARDISEVLRGLDFRVETRLDLGKAEIGEVIENFYRRIGDRDAVSLVYYAGHAIQRDNVNYLIPVDADISGPASLEREAYGFNRLLAGMGEARSRTNIVILDACRNNPFSVQAAADGRGQNAGPAASGRGLAPIDAPPGTLIAYATEPGKVAKDGAGRNGTYTKYLLKYLGLPVGIEKMFKTVRAAVMRETGNNQVPWEHSSLYRDFLFRRDEAAEVPSLPSF